MSTTKRGRPRKFDRDSARALRRRVKNGESTAVQEAENAKVSLATIHNVIGGKGVYANTL